MTKFPNKGWTKSILLMKLRKYGAVDSSSVQSIAHTNENVDLVAELR